MSLGTEKQVTVVAGSVKGRVSCSLVGSVTEGLFLPFLCPLDVGLTSSRKASCTSRTSITRLPAPRRMTSQSFWGSGERVRQDWSQL